ncbi:hypothetical protein VT84_30940 [Gemmata sp. SH-PL17]|uniref:hypothetical protein n=1 Tax=Gemmata sp. SH-PL17 TaxID=1630693 RepID=UPI00078E7F93|nr:hypothetical protein [Gemmata sp. SH-PL17]AMV28851.1 hypothetical protein VT84_30940 [Gemmata sp. SH-PL17]
MTDDEFLTAFEECRLVRTDWTHEAHVRMAWLYLMRVEAKAGAVDRVRGGIQKLNATFVHRDRLENPNRPPKPKDPRGLDGYHETVTVAFVTVIASRVKANEDFAAFRARNPDLFDRNLSALLRHYSPERLYSLPARTQFLEPDLEPLPG